MTAPKASAGLFLRVATAVLFAVSLLVSGIASTAHAATSTPPDFNLSLNGNLNNTDPAGPASVSMGAGTASYVAGQQGQAIQLDYQDYVQLDSTSAPIDYTNSWSVAFWVKINSYSADSAIAGNKDWNSGSNNGWVFNTGGGDIKLNLKDPSSSRDDITYTAITPGQWEYVAATFDYSSGTVTAYLNGQQIEADSRAFSNLAGAGPTLLGQAYAGTGLYNTASGPANQEDMADFVMAPSALPASQILSMYQAGLPPTVTGVSVAPQNIRLEQGSTYRFPAIVTGTGNPSQAVTWTVSGGTGTTAIAPDGTLTIDPDQAGSLTVTATSVYDPTQSGTATVSVVPPRSDGNINFGVVADMHTTTTPGDSANTRAANALQFLSAPAQDNQAIINDGDLQSNDTWPEYVSYQGIVGANAQLPVYATMGAHENADYASFTAATGDQPNYVKVIDGYTFIMLSAGAGTLDTTTGVPSQPSSSDYTYLESWVKQQVAAAEAAAPSKPVFVFRFDAIPNTNFTSGISGDTGTGMENLFNGDPHVVLFTADGHNPNNDPLNIWQDGGYTVVNIPATVSAELEGGMKSGSNTPFAYEMSQGLEVSADSSGNVDIKTRDFLSSQYVQDWSFNVNQPLPYTTASRLPQAKAPVFASGDQITLSNLNTTTATATFPQATEPANGAQDGVHDYQYTITDDQTGQVVQQYLDWNPYWIVPEPATITEDLDGLAKSTQYTLQVCGEDHYGLFGTGSGCLTTTFTTPAFNTTPHELVDYALPFNGSLANSGQSPDAAMLQVAGSTMSDVQNYVAGNDGGQAIALDPTHVVELDPNQLIDYGQSFTTAFWMNVTSVRSDGQPVILSNRNVDSDDNTGYDFFTNQHSDGRVWLELEFHPVNGVYTDVPLAPITDSTWTSTAVDAASNRYLLTAPGPDWMHVAATFDYANNLVTAYINGVQVAQVSADLSGGIGGVTGQGLIQSTFLGSSPWNYTEEYGGFNGSGTEGRHYIALDVDDFVLASTVYTPAQIAAEMANFNDRPATYTATFNAEGGNPAPASQTVFDGVTMVQPAPPFLAGATFNGWFTAPGGGTQWNFATDGLTANTTLYAQYTYDTSTAVATSGSPTQTGAQVTYTATVTPAPNGGTVSFTDNGSPVAGCSAAPVSGSTATCTTTPAAAGAHNVTAAYGGVAAQFYASTSPVITQVVTAVPCSALAGCDLHGLNLSGAQLSGAGLSNANLNGSNLDGADLSGVNLTGANLNAVNLTGANLTGATLTSTTNLNKVTWSGTTCPDGTSSNADGGTCTGHLTASA